MANELNRNQFEDSIACAQPPEAWESWDMRDRIPESLPGQCADYQYLKQSVSYIDKSDYIQGPSAATGGWPDQFYQRVNPTPIPAELDVWEPPVAKTTENQPNVEHWKELDRLDKIVTRLEKQ